MCKQLFVRDQLLLARGQDFKFHLRPLVAEENSAPGVQLLGILKLFPDLGSEERKIDSIPGIAHCLHRREGVRAALFFRDHNVDIELLRGGNGSFHSRARGRNLAQ